MAFLLSEKTLFLGSDFMLLLKSSVDRLYYTTGFLNLVSLRIPLIMIEVGSYTFYCFKETFPRVINEKLFVKYIFVKLL